jgi:hypothetical protein
MNLRKLPLIIALLLSITAFPQSKKELQLKIDSLITVTNTLKNETEALKSENIALKNAINKIESTVNEAANSFPKTANQQIGTTTGTSTTPSSSEQPIKKQCKATTQSGTQCSRNSEDGSDYCWQHKTQTSATPSTTPKPGSSSYSGSKSIQTGSRGGQYYINSKGNKTYVKRK